MSVSQTQTRQPVTILVVEDMEVIRALSARILAEAAYGVLTASDGVEAMEALERSSPVDLVLTDLKMPRMDGHQLALQVASRWPGLRVLFMTGYPEVRLADDLPGPLLLKPFTPEQLIAAVRALLVDRHAGDRRA